MYSASSYDTLITCPFNPSHRIEAGKLAGHVIKCQKNYGNIVVTCPLNATHKIHSGVIVHHLSECDGRRHLEASMFLKDPEQEKKYCVPRTMEVPSEEDWDNGPAVPAYNPDEYCMKNKVIRYAKVEPPLVRKTFRAEQRARIQQLDSESPLPTPPRVTYLGTSSSVASSAPVEAKTVWDIDETAEAAKVNVNNWTKVKSSRGKNNRKK